MSKKAVVIGIDEYPGGMRLHGSVNDATKFAELIRYNGRKSTNCEVELYKNVRTKSDLRRLIQRAFSGTTETAVLYFSGHGLVNELGGYVVTPDAARLDEGVSMDDILKMANLSRCRNKIIILDCCHSAAIGDLHFEHRAVVPVGDGVTIMAASRKNEPAYEIDGHGVFTYLLLDALKGGAADIRGHITPAGIYYYIDQSLGEFEQRPVFKANISHFVSFRDLLPQVDETVLQNIIEHFPDPHALFSLDPSFEEYNHPDKKIEPVEPYADPINVARLKELQQLQSVGLVVPVDAPYMFFAAMHSKSCALTPLGRHYWRLARKGRIS